MTHRQVYKGSQYDTIPSIEVDLLTSTDGPQALGALDEVTFIMWPADGSDTIIEEVAATIVDPGVADTTSARVRYDLEDIDVDEAGTFLAQFVVHWATGGTTRYPRPEPFRVELAPSRRLEIS
jgi:hypothetical protein